jgi:hypothetical protein
MTSYKPVSISNASFVFCRFSLAILVWSSYLLKSEFILAFVCIIFLLSAILKVQKAPMIRLYDITVGKFTKTKEILVDENSLFFAHSLAFILATICFIMVFFFKQSWSWYVVLGFAVLKTISAFGFCPASKFYDCTINGNCCINK